MRQNGASALALLGCVLMTGCVDNRYLAPAATFRDSTIKTISTVSSFYSSRNGYEMDIYLDTLAADPSLSLAGTDSSGKPTPLIKPAFTPASIQARLDALALVGEYATRLCELTNSSAASDFSDANTALGKSLVSLSNTFQSLGSSGDSTAGSYVQPVSTLVGIVGQMWINHKRNDMAKDAIRNGAGPVKAILDQIGSDMTNVFALQLSAGASDKIATLVTAYNHDRAGLSYDQRVSRLAEVRAAVESGSASSISAPARLVAAMEVANQALLDAANQTHPSFTELNTALSTWSSEIQTLASQIQPLVK